MTPPVLTSTMTIGTSANTHYGIWGHQAFPQGAIDDSDFLALYFFEGSTPLTIGDQVTVSAGIVTLPDFFIEPGATYATGRLPQPR